MSTTNLSKQSNRMKGGWQSVAFHELKALWGNGRALILLILSSIILGITSFLLVTNAELRAIPTEIAAEEMIITIIVGLFISMLLGVNSINGNQGKTMLDELPFVPTSRQIIIGKFLAAFSLWPLILGLEGIHLLVVLPKQLTLLLQTLLLGGILGSFLIASFTAFGMLLSMVSKSNRLSLFFTSLITILFLLHTQFSGATKIGKYINPIGSIQHVIKGILVDNHTLQEMASWLIAPIVLCLVTTFFLFVYVASKLTFNGDKSHHLQSKKGMIKLIPFLFIFPLFSYTTGFTQENTNIQILIDKETVQSKTGDTFDYTTVVKNISDSTTSEMLMAMNIINLGDDVPIDTEDWSEIRRQSLTPLEAGQSVELNWSIDTILHGEYLAYMVIIDAPNSPDSTTFTVAQKGIHITVVESSTLKVNNVLPVIVGIPVILTGLLIAQKIRQKKQVT